MATWSGNKHKALERWRCDAMQEHRGGMGQQDRRVATCVVMQTCNAMATIRYVNTEEAHWHVEAPTERATKKNRGRLRSESCFRPHCYRKAYLSGFAQLNL